VIFWTPLGAANFGRWHNPATTGALYFAAELSTALSELHAHMDPPFPDIVQAVEATVRLQRLLDLTVRRVPVRL
jgi:RES domain-containing protein